MAECSVSRCSHERRVFRKELHKWSKEILYILGLERLAEELMGARKWKILVQPFSDLENDCSCDWFPEDTCYFCCAKKQPPYDPASGIIPTLENYNALRIDTDEHSASSDQGNLTDTGQENDSDESFSKLFHDLSNEEFLPDYDYLKDDRIEEKRIEGENASKVISNSVQNMNGKELFEGDNSLRSHKDCVNVKMQIKCSNLVKHKNDKEIKDQDLLRNNVDCVDIQMECSNLQYKNDTGSIKNDNLLRNSANQIAEKIITPTQNVNKLVQPKVKATRRKIRNPDEWKRKKSAICREKGEAYINYKGEVQPAKPVFLGSLCPDTCRLRCSQAFTSEQRVEIFSNFYKLDINAKNALLYNSIKMKSIKRKRLGALKPKAASFEYNIACSGTQTKVCKRAFVLLYSISTGKIELIQRSMKTGLASPPPDKRGRHNTRPCKIPDNVISYIIQHISNLPVEESHCSKNCNIQKKYPSSQMSLPHLYKHYLEKCDAEQVGSQFKVKECTFRNILKKHCNFNFGLPKRDVCDSGSVYFENE